MLNELNLTPELLEKAKSATSAAALLALAQENGITLTAEEAANYYTQLHPKAGELSDEELDNVSGGACGEKPTGKTLAIQFALLTYCDRDPKCFASKAQNSFKKDLYRGTPKRMGKLCHGCPCRPLIDSQCRSSCWPILESAPPVPHIR